MEVAVWHAALSTFNIMAEPLKNIYNPAFFQEFSTAVSSVVPGFNTTKFLADCKRDGWEQMELKQRMRHLSSVLNKYLQGDYKKKISQVLKIMNALPAKSSTQYGSLAYMLIPDFVEQYGLEETGLSLKAMEKITAFTSCEFAIRPYLIRYPQEVMAQMLLWSKHPSDKVRRFASEGCRPRLPWAIAIPSLKRSPLPILPVLENLKNDPSEFVRRSVANNLNDIAKDHPDLVIIIAKSWQGSSPETDKLIKHGCRSLLRQAHADALNLFGTGANVHYSVKNFSLHKNRIAKGETLIFSFSVELNEKKPAKLRIEYALYFMKKTGNPSKKIFKIAENTYPTGKELFFTRSLSFKDLTTRKHYPGKHSIAIVVNGKECCTMDFILKL